MPRYANGELACDDQGRCPNAHGYECRMGRVCCPSGTDGTGLCHPYAFGRACLPAMPGQCQVPNGFNPDRTINSPRAAARCLSSIRFGTDAPPLSGVVAIPGGYCSSSCKPGLLNACGDDGVCVDLGSTGRYDGDPLAGTNNDGFCLARCRVPLGHTPATPLSGCRAETAGGMSPFRCFPVIPGDPQSTEGFCFPDCTISDYCAPASTPLFRVQCNRTTRSCESGR